VKSERRANDHYVTPESSIRRFLELYQPPLPKDRIGFALDPCAARGELIKTARPLLPGTLWAACEIDSSFESSLVEVVGKDALVMGDFLQRVPLLSRCSLDLVLTNPPYNQAEAFIRGALQVAPVVAMLLRINFLASQKRRDFLASTKPGIFVLPNRPTFNGDGADMTEYAWFVFGDERVAGRIAYCALTPLDEIRRDKERAREIHAPGA
jgi:hypothetical protein